MRACASGASERAACGRMFRALASTASAVPTSSLDGSRKKWPAAERRSSPERLFQRRVAVRCSAMASSDHNPAPAQRAVGLIRSWFDERSRAGFDLRVPVRRRRPGAGLGSTGPDSGRDRAPSGRLRPLSAQGAFRLSAAAAPTSAAPFAAARVSAGGDRARRAGPPAGLGPQAGGPGLSAGGVRRARSPARARRSSVRSPETAGRRWCVRSPRVGSRRSGRPVASPVDSRACRSCPAAPR